MAIQGVVGRYGKCVNTMRIQASCSPSKLSGPCHANTPVTRRPYCDMHQSSLHIGLPIRHGLLSCQSERQERQKDWQGAKATRLKAYEALVGLAAAIQHFLQRASPKEFQAEERPVRAAFKTLRMAAVVVPFASAGMGGTAYLVTRAIASFLQTYLLLLFLRVLLSWFPTFNWERQPWLTLRQMTDPYLQLFRGLIPPLLGMIDFTPLLGFFVLQWISGELQSITMEGDVEEFW